MKFELVFTRAATLLNVYVGNILYRFSSNEFCKQSCDVQLFVWFTFKSNNPTKYLYQHRKVLNAFLKLYPKKFQFEFQCRVIFLFQI